jgi:hypothetical protein
MTIEELVLGRVIALGDQDEIVIPKYTNRKRTDPIHAPTKK